MRVILILLFIIFRTVFGISTKEEKLLDEEFHRRAEDVPTSKTYDLLNEGTVQQNTHNHIDSGRHAYVFPRIGYSVHESGNEPEAIPGNDPAVLHSSNGYGGHIPQVYGNTAELGYGGHIPQVYGNNAELGQANGYNIHLPHSYGQVADLAYYPYGYGSSVAHYPGSADCFGYGYHHADYNHRDGGEFGITDIGNYIKKKLTLKKIFLPLAGIALLAAAGAWSSANPLLLQLGTLGAATGRSRVKRSNTQNPFIKPKLKDKITK